MEEERTTWRTVRSARPPPRGRPSSLQVSALHTLPAARTASDPDTELGRDRARPRKVDLVLVGGALEDEVAAAVRTARRKRGVELLIDPLRHQAVTVAAMGLPRAATGRGLLPGRIAPRERGSLGVCRIGGTPRETLQLGDAGITVGERFVNRSTAAVRRRISSEELVVGAGLFARRSAARRNSQRYARPLRRWWIPLSKYGRC